MIGFSGSWSPWQILLPAGVGTALSLVGDSALYTVLPTHTAVAGVALASVGILLSANRLIRILANSVAGWTSDRVSKRLVFLFSLFLGAFSTAIYGMSSGFAWLLVGRLLWGIAWSGIWVAGNGLILETAPVHERGRWVGRYHFFFFLGAALGAALGGLLTDGIGYHEAMMAAAGLQLVGALAALIFLPAGQMAVARDGQDARPMEVEKEEVGEKEGNNWGELLSASAVQGVNRLVIAGIMASTLALFLRDMLGESVDIGGAVIGVATVTGILSGARILLGMLFTPAIGSLSDRAGSRWQVVAGGLLPGIAGFVLLAINLPLAMLLGLPLTSITGSSNQSLSTALIGDLGQRRRHGRYLGLLYTVGDLGSAIGPLLAFALLPLWGISGLYWFNAVLFGLLLVVALFWAGRKQSTINKQQSTVNS
jgi:MFS family permease